MSRSPWMMIRYLAFLTCTLIATGTKVSSCEAGAPPVQKRNPPSVGEIAPDFTLNDLSGRSVKLSELTAKSPVVLVVLRGYPGYQCPICTRQVGELVAHVQDLNAATAQVVLVYPGSAAKLTERAGKFIKGKSLPA